MIKTSWLGVVAFLVSASAAAATGLTVTSDGTTVRGRPDESAPAVMHAKKGQRFTTDGTRKDGFYRLATKSGRAMWVAESDVQADGDEAAAQADAVGPPEAKAHASASAESAEEPPFRRLTFDLGGASNFSNGSSAYEVHLGVNFYVLRWLVWRNAPFYRSQSGADAEYGLDSSVQGRYGIKLIEGIEPSVMLGAGYRVVNVSAADAPFVEGGLGVHAAGLGVEATVKQIFHSVTTAGMENERLFSLSVSGGVSF